MTQTSSSEQLLRRLPILCMAVLLPLVLGAIAINLQQKLCHLWCREERLGIVSRTIGLMDSVSVAAGLLILGLLVAFVLLLVWGSWHIDGFVLFVCALLIVPLLGVFVPITFPPTDIVIPGLDLVVLVIIHAFGYLIAWAIGAALWPALISVWKRSAVDEEQWTHQQQRAWIVGWMIFSVVDFFNWMVFGIGARAGIKELFTTWVIAICLLSWIIGLTSVVNHPHLGRRERDVQ